MEYLIFLYGFIAVVILIFVKKLKSNKEPEIKSQDYYEYESTGSIVTPTELAFYRALTVTVKDRHLIFSKVRIADVITPKKGKYDKSTWHKAFNKIAKKHYDFVLCDPTTLKVEIVIELDDSSHSRPDRIRRDNFVNNATCTAGIPLMRVPVSKSYDYFELEQLLYGEADDVTTTRYASR